jgi:hypothetical protein
MHANDLQITRAFNFHKKSLTDFIGRNQKLFIYQTMKNQSYKQALDLYNSIVSNKLANDIIDKDKSIINAIFKSYKFTHIEIYPTLYGYRVFLESVDKSYILEVERKCTQ